MQYLNALKKYQEDVSTIQNNYRSQIDIYQAMAAIYQGQMVQYQEDLADYTVARVTAVSAERGSLMAWPHIAGGPG